MIVRSALKSYTVDFVYGLKDSLQSNHGANVYYVVDSNVYTDHTEVFSFISPSNICILEAVEDRKNLETVTGICENLVRLPSKRNTRLVSVGGGIVQDITGFVANVTYRGIAWTFYPSTLLAAVDSCIGGKTSLNFKGFKNLLGTFYAPDCIYIDSSLFKTLSRRDYLSGLGEIVKFNIMSGNLDNLIQNMGNLLRQESNSLAHFITTSLALKKEYIEADEFDRGERVLLNYGHTFGHAFEVSSHFEIPHGTAVALGLVTANRISECRGILAPNLKQKIESIIHNIVGLPLKSDWFEFKEIIPAILKDKKQLGNNINAVLLKDGFILNRFNDLTVDEINDAITYLVKDFLQMGGGIMNKTSRIVIFGAGGLIGSTIVAKLKEGGYTNVIGCTHSMLELTSQNDVQKFFRENKPEYIFFCAVKSITDFEVARVMADSLQVNLMMLCNVIDCARKFEVAKGVFLGSAMLYPWDETYEKPLTEDLLDNPDLKKYRPSMESTVLGKYVGMKLCQYYHEQYRCKFVYALPTHIYGGFYNRKHLYFLERLVMSICEAKVRGESSLYLDVFGEGKALKQFLHVDDCADAIIKIMHCYDEYASPINVANPKSESWSSIVGMIREIVGYDGEILFNSNRKENLSNRICSTEKLDSLGWQPKITMRRGLEMLCEEYMRLIA